jgi:hypothetical protein
VLRAVRLWKPDRLRPSWDVAEALEAAANAARPVQCTRLVRALGVLGACRTFTAVPGLGVDLSVGVGLIYPEVLMEPVEPVRIRIDRIPVVLWGEDQDNHLATGREAATLEVKSPTRSQAALPAVANDPERWTIVRLGHGGLGLVVVIASEPGCNDNRGESH